MTGFEIHDVVPDPMSDIVFDKNAVWKNKVTISSASTVIIAPSGSGKTSLHAFMYGTRDNYSGTIRFNGDDLKKISLRQWSQLRQQSISVIFQDLRLLPHLTVHENLLLKNNLTKHKTVDEIRFMTEQLGIGEKWNQVCKTLSFGQQQRVAIIRSLLQPFEFLLADEPFSHIDDSNIEKAKKLIDQECKNQNGSFVLFSLGSEYGITFNERHHL